MSMPLVSKAQIVAHLRLVGDELEPIVEVSDIYPSVDDIVKYGVYVEDVHYVTRDIDQNAVSFCGKIYNATDSFNVLFVSFQNDPNAPAIEEAIQGMVVDLPMFDGYHEITFSQVNEIGNRSEKKTYTFNLKRLDFNT